MTACICVDYLAHDWDVNDIIQAHHEIKKQRLQGKRKQQDSSKAYQVEQDKLIRYENAVWRQMAKICTHQLGRSNRQINPSAVNWQKESDITWLYGPLYTTTPSLTFPPTPPLKGIKSVLKKQPISLPPYRPWSKTCSEPGTSTVRFNPDIQELEYLPESPIVRKSPHTYYWPEDDEDDEDDDALISMLE
ncbi:hypothetical protein BC941DRAFT_449008 [Chlamydoabsidia padenii]|nr:hypothetical protein BC941DRAFT_449008 [Chlamydoabsidia padenii]